MSCLPIREKSNRCGPGVSWEADTGGMAKGSECLEQRKGGECGGGQVGKAERSSEALQAIKRSQHPAYTVTAASFVTPSLVKHPCSFMSLIKSEPTL